MSVDELTPALDRTEGHMRRERLRGYDPYDALCSPLFGLPGLRTNRLARFGAQQALKRFPINIRPLLGISKGLNPVSVALYLQGLVYRSLADGTRDTRRAEIERCIQLLGDLASPGWSGACWGYPFDWEARYASIPAGLPTIVATGMVTNALAVADEALGLPAARELILSASVFIREDLHRTNGPEGSFCWSYSPVDHQVVLNATMKGSRLLAQAYARGGGAELLEPAQRSVRFVVAHQDESGAWPYAIGDTRRWADNFHTGYVLECLADYQRLSGDLAATEALQRGWAYYRDSFFTPDFTPRYYDDHTLPIDATACAQAILTLCRFDDVEAAQGVARRSIELLGRPDGSFAYQARRRSIVRIPYLRWSTAWMYCALARLSMATSSPA